MLRKIAAEWILPVSGNPIHNGILTFSEKGELVGIVLDCPNPMEQVDVEYYDGVLIPGMVNTHNHLELSYMKGILSENSGLPGFVQHILETKSSFSEGVQRAFIATADMIMWNEGTQAVGDISNTAYSFQTKKRSSIKYVTYLEFFDTLFKIDAEACLSGAQELLTEADHYGIEAHPTLHATYSVSDKLFKQLPTLRGTDSLSIHYKESKDDDLLFQKKGRFHDLFIKKGIPVDYYAEGSSTNRILNAIPADRRLLLVHNSNVNEEDILRLTKTYKELSWALCPRSNFYIERVLPPVELLRKHNLNLTVGTDSLSSNHTLSLVEELKLLDKSFNVGMEELVRWATINGAKALKLDSYLGSFEIGKRPGVVLLENTKALKFTPETTSRRIL